MVPEFYFAEKKLKKKIIIRIASALIICLLNCGLFSACSEVNAEAFPRKEVKAYNEKTIPVPSQYSLDLECDYGNIEFYNWGRQEIKFEITHRVRNRMPVEELERLLSRFKTSISKKEGSVSFTCSYTGKNGSYDNTFTVIRVYAPSKPSAVQCRLKHGQISFLDDLETFLTINADKAEITINRFKGVVKYSGKSGNINIASGFIHSQSSVNVQNGNIKIRADFEVPGIYTINAGTGIITLDLPEYLDAVFEGNGSIDPDESSKAVVAAKFLIKNNIGKVEVNRY